MTPDLTEDDKAALIELLRETIERDRFLSALLLGFVALAFVIFDWKIGLTSIALCFNSNGARPPARAEYR